MRIQDQEWYKKTTRDLRQLKTWKKRVEIIKLRLLKECMPDEKLIASYGSTVKGNNPEEINRLEVELQEKERKIKELEIALDALTDNERKIIDLKYFREKKDYIIYELEEPMSSKTFYEALNNAVEKIGQCLGYIAC